MIRVLSAFDDRAAAEAAAARVREAGLPASAVHVVDRGQPINRTSIEVDELATGGMVHSVMHLLDGLFGTVAPKREAATYTDAVRMEQGAAVVVETEDEAQAAGAERLLRDVGATRLSRAPANEPAG